MPSDGTGWWACLACGLVWSGPAKRTCGCTSGFWTAVRAEDVWRLLDPVGKQLLLPVDEDDNEGDGGKER